MEKIAVNTCMKGEHVQKIESVTFHADTSLCAQKHNIPRRVEAVIASWREEGEGGNYILLPVLLG